MSNNKNYRGGNNYINKYPSLQKWIQQCLFCQSEGYNPAMPDFLGVSPFGPTNIRSMFPPIILNEEEICEQCENAQLSLKEKVK